MTEQIRHRLVGAGALPGVATVAIYGWAQRRRFAPVPVGDVAPAYRASSLGGANRSLEAQELTVPVRLDPEHRVDEVVGVTGLPTTFVIGPEGRVRDRVVGPARSDEPPRSTRIGALLEG